MCGRDLRCATSSRRSGDLLLLGRASSTISREVDANGGRTRYRACIADKAAVRRTRRPKRSKLASRLRLSLSEREEISRGLAGGESLRAIAWRDRCDHDEASRAGGLRLGDHGLGTDVGERLSDREPPGVEVDVSPGEAERLSATQARTEQQCPERREWIVGRWARNLPTSAGDQARTSARSARGGSAEVATLRAARPICAPISRLGNPIADNRAISSFSRSDNRSTPHLPIDPTRSKDVMR